MTQPTLKCCTMCSPYLTASTRSRSLSRTIAPGAATSLPATSTGGLLTVHLQPAHRVQQKRGLASLPPSHNNPQDDAGDVWLSFLPKSKMQKSHWASSSSVTLQQHLQLAERHGYLKPQAQPDVKPPPFFTPSFGTVVKGDFRQASQAEVQTASPRRSHSDLITRPRFEPDQSALDTPPPPTSQSSKEPSGEHQNEGLWAEGEGGPEGQEEPTPPWMSEHEYRVRVGRAVHLLRTTLPEFMTEGLVDYPDTLPKQGDESDAVDPTEYGLYGRAGKGIAPAGNGIPLDPIQQGYFMDEFMGAKDRVGKKKQDDSIYHPQLQFVFNPPVHHSVGTSSSEKDKEPQPALSFSGRTLYLASSQVLRTALTAIFSNATVHVERIYLTSNGAGGSALSKQGRTLRSPPAPRDPATSPPLAAEDELIVRLVFKGKVRVTRYPHEYTAVFRYTFDKESGQIKRHVVEKIQPAPGKKLWAGLAMALQRAALALGGLGLPRWPIAVPLPHPEPAPTRSVAVRNRRRQTFQDEQD